MKNFFVCLCFVLFSQPTAVAFAAEFECPASAASIDEAVTQTEHFREMRFAADVSVYATQKQIDNIMDEKKKDPASEAVQRLLEKAKEDREAYEIILKSMDDLYKCGMKHIAGN